ncbi:unnamed protein product [Clavelina lepadiformis]|uniref:Uncharacterized protein n=1 Tax=Clavelina lepadiformis TaxID=159417 RepID=A0ABP0FS07_CLALP
MVGIFTLSILPVALVILSLLFVGTIYFSQPRRVDVQGALVYNTFEFISIIILSCNSLWNFFIYNGRNLEFRNEVKTMIKSIFKKLSLARCCQSKTIDDQRAVAVNNARPTPSTPASLDSKEETLKRCSLASSANRLNTHCTVLDQSPDIIRRNPNLCTFLGSDGKSETSIDKLDLKTINRNQVDSPHLIETNTPGCKVESGFSKENNRSFTTDANADETSLSCINKTNDMVSTRPTEIVRTSLDEEIV